MPAARDLERAGEAFIEAYHAAPRHVQAMLMEFLEAVLGFAPLKVDSEGTRYYALSELAAALEMTQHDLLELGKHSPGVVLVADK
jgi:hypothetical protein